MVLLTHRVILKIQLKSGHIISCTPLIIVNDESIKSFARAIGSNTVIFFLSIVKVKSFKSPNNLVIVTLVEPIASAIA